MIVFERHPSSIGIQRGVTSIEYALLVALIALAIIGALASTGAETGGLWNDWTTKALAALNK